MNKSFIITLVPALLSAHISIEASIQQAQNQLPANVYELNDEGGNEVFVRPQECLQYTQKALGKAFEELLDDDCDVDEAARKYYKRNPAVVYVWWQRIKNELPRISYLTFLRGLVLAAKFMGGDVGLEYLNRRDERGMSDTSGRDFAIDMLTM